MFLYWAQVGVFYHLPVLVTVRQINQRTSDILVYNQYCDYVLTLKSYYLSCTRGQRKHIKQIANIET